MNSARIEIASTSGRSPLGPLAEVRGSSQLARLSASYAWCERLARRQAGNFYHAFRLLPTPPRRAMCALYAFMRVADDLTDSGQSVAEKRLALTQWRQQLDAALAGVYYHPLYPAFHHTVEQYCIPRRYLEDVLDGVAMDLETTCYATFEELYRYCYRVASAVGLACIHIWGFRDKRAISYAESAGIALQLTNILRDLGEDTAQRSGLSAAAQDLDRFGYRVEDLEHGRCNEQFRALMRFQVERAAVITIRRRRWRSCSTRRGRPSSSSCCAPIAACWRRLSSVISTFLAAESA